LLKEQLAAYRTLASRPSLTQLPPLPKRSISEGDMYEGVDRLRTLLSALGDLQSADPDASTAPDVLDASLILAMKRFQQRHGLNPDGVLGRKTYAALTTPLAQRVRQIELTMERWRWLPPLEAPLVVVNIPQFMVVALPTENHAAVESPVVVGTLQNRTPVFASSIQSVIFRPFWDIPYSISTREILPLARRNPEYLARNHMELVRGQSDNGAIVEPTPENLERVVTGELRLRQRPGADNALGLIKFMLPNAYDVYLHDTPAAALFGAERRAFSHGCIRVGKPVELAYYVLQNAGEPWTRDAIENAMCGTETLRVKLPKPIPIMVLYGTAVASATRGMSFFDDLYGLDRKLETLLGLQRIRERLTQANAGSARFRRRADHQHRHR
jgi:murein L,D-transpeptidase YcbB/YkuD